MERRVVVTGIGAVTPIGNTATDFWAGIKAGKCGIDEITKVDTSDLKVKLAAEVKDFNPEDYFDRRTARRMDLYSQYAVVASREALKDSGITEENTDMTRVGTVIGSGIGGLNTMEKDIGACAIKGPDRVSPMFIPMGIPNMAAGNVTIDLGLKGESVAMVTACATGTHSIGESYRMIKHGYQDAVLAGGTEAPITKTGIAGFQNIKALTQATDKNRASIPFDLERSGFVMGEGAACLVLEEMEHALARGAKIYAEVVGAGMSADAYHLTASHPEGLGAILVMKNALEDAEMKPEDIDYINVHGTSTPVGDISEVKAIQKVFGEHAYKLNISSTKSMTGHLLGAAGALEAIVSIKAVQEDIVPPTINHVEGDNDPEIDYNLNFTFNKAQKRTVNAALSNTFGFGGHNASVIVKKFVK